MTLVHNLTGKKFGRLKIQLLLKERRGKSKRIVYRTICDCGNICKILGSQLTSGKTKSCGCLKKENLIKRNTTHNLTYDPFYWIFNSILQRCYKKCSEGKNYKGRGIKCEWKSFEDFRDDMYQSYRKHKSKNKTTEIDRIDNNGNYSKKKL